MTGPRFNFDPVKLARPQHLTVDKQKAWDALGRTGMLSERELQVVAMMVIGMHINEMSESLFLSGKTVSTYRSRIHDKLGTNGNDAELVRMAMAYDFLFDANAPEYKLRAWEVGNATVSNPA